MYSIGHGVRSADTTARQGAMSGSVPAAGDHTQLETNTEDEQEAPSGRQTTRQ